MIASHSRQEHEFACDSAFVAKLLKEAIHVHPLCELLLHYGHESCSRSSAALNTVRTWP